MYFHSIANLLAQPGPIDPDIEYTVGGYYTRGDGGGGTFIWIPFPQGLPQDKGIIFYTTNDPGGYFQRIFSGPVNVRWFGAIKGAYDPNPDPGYPNIIFDVTPYVHSARNSEEFANNGTLYFPKGEYPGAFVFTHAGLRNEINIIGDGWGTVLKAIYKPGNNNQLLGEPILTLGVEEVHWRWKKVSNLRLDGMAKVPGKYGNLVDVKWSDGIRYANPPSENHVAGRWKIDQVIFTNCRYGVHKPYGNIGNHYIDCSWRKNVFGVYAVGNPGGGMHNGCDRYSGCEFEECDDTAVYYQDYQGGGGQIIFDGTVFEENPIGIHIVCTDGARLLPSAISIRNAYLENSLSYANGEKDLVFEGVRSVRIEDCKIAAMTLKNSSVNLFNCSDVSGNERLSIDSRSSIVAYEQRYLLGVSELVFVYSISYDASSEIGHSDNDHTPPVPATGQQTSVWGPLRVVTATKNQIIESVHFDDSLEEWHNWGDWGATNVHTFSSFSLRRVLGKRSNQIYMDAGKHIWASNIISTNLSCQILVILSILFRTFVT